LPLNLFLSLAVRGFVSRLLSRKRLKVLGLIFFLVIAVLPSLAANTGLGAKLKVFFIAAAQVPGTPWNGISSLALGRAPLLSLVITTVWIAIAYWWARREFANTISTELAPFRARRATIDGTGAQSSYRNFLFRIPSKLFQDPLAALIEKEVLVLSRSPRFRLIFGMACLFSVVIFFPLAFGRAHSSPLAENFLPAVTGYGLLIVGETLLWNCFGFDRRAAQLYFVSPVPLATVFRAKNIVAAFVVGLMTLVVSLLGSLVGRGSSPRDLISTFLMMAVLTVFFVSFGNFTSVALPRPIDPNQALKNQNNAKASALLLVCAVILVIPMGLALLARWAFEAEWPFFAVLLADLIIGIVFYVVTTESAIERANNDRERILLLLSQDSKPIES
jgi:ABC-2 type transport system permease protein